MEYTAIDELLGETLDSAVIAKGKYKDIDGSDVLVLTSGDKEWLFGHRQDCCETVSLIDEDQDLSVLVGSPITMAEIAYESGGLIMEGRSDTWSFLKLATVKGYVTLRWFGESNGYYSEDMNLYTSTTDSEFTVRNWEL